MLWINIITTVCLAVLLTEVLFVILSTIMKKRTDRIEFLRGFKKGKCVIIYLTALPLYIMGHLYAADSAVDAVFKSIGEIFNLVVLQYNTGSIMALMAANGYYEFTIRLCFVLACINALILTLSLVDQYLWTRRKSIRARMPFGEKLFIFGNSSENIAIYNSEDRRFKAIIADVSAEEGARLYMDNVAYINSPSGEAGVELIFNQAGKFDRECVSVINTGSDDENIAICRAVIEKIRGADGETREKLFLKMKFFVFGDPRYEAIYNAIAGDGHGCIHYVNKYRRIATEFIDKYPLTRFMDERHIDYSTSLMRPGVDINVVMIGFGKTSQQIFLTSVANNQFLEEAEGDPALKRVKYFIFDKKAAENDKNLNHSYYRFKHESASFDEDKYLPLPSLPAEEHYRCLDINSVSFYGEIKSIVAAKPEDVSFIVIAFGSDLDNIDMASKLIEKRNEWGLKNLTVFVKARRLRKEDTLISDPACYFIGNEADDVYDIDKITGDKLHKMAMMRNEVYRLESGIKQKKGLKLDDAYIRESKMSSAVKWYKELSEMERESSVYCCLSLRSKLNLMGLDYCPKDGEDGLTNEEYIALYARGDIPDTKTYNIKADGKPVVHYTLDFPPSRRRNMAIHEHQRWNSFMISHGMIPSGIEEIVGEYNVLGDGTKKYTNGKNYSVRRHGNLTTFEGLAEFRRLVAERDGRDELECDVISYDYQLLDDAFWLLDKNGYKIIKKSSADIGA